MGDDDAVAGVLLAGGAGRRYGMPKALVEHDGRLLVETAAAVLRDGGCRPVVVVLGAAADTVRARADLTGTTVVDNPLWEQGMGTTLRAGLDAVRDLPGVVAALVLPVDVPGVTVAAVRRVRAAATPTALVRASYDGVAGHPVLLGRDHWAGAYASATADRGARDYLRSHPVADVPCGDVGTGEDVDRPEDLRQLAGSALLLTDFVARYNAGLRSGDFTQLLALLADDAEISVHGPTLGPFRGAGTSGPEPDGAGEGADELVLLDVSRRGDELVGGWARRSRPEVRAGELRLLPRDGRVARLAITAGQPTGR